MRQSVQTSLCERTRESVKQVNDLLDGLDRARQDMEIGKVRMETYLRLAARYAEKITDAVNYSKSVESASDAESKATTAKATSAA